MRLLSYRNLGEKGGPEFSITEVKDIAAGFEVTDGPNSQGEMFTRPGRPSDRFVSTYPNIESATAANGGAYPPDMSVLVKSRKGGADYIYSVLMGYDDPPQDFKLDEGVHYNKYMDGNKIKMAKPLMEGIVSYSDGTNATEDQMAKDVTTFLTWSSEPHLESRHKMGIKVIIYLIILATLVYFSMRKLWSRVDSEK
jgi:ubiquinol-cytochrome c reductase cytochrome c1 subunit